MHIWNTNNWKAGTKFSLWKKKHTILLKEKLLNYKFSPGSCELLESVMVSFQASLLPSPPLLMSVTHEPNFKVVFKIQRGTKKKQFKI